MWACRRMRGLLAAAVYEPLAPAERTRLDEHLARCPGCRTQLDEWVRFAQALPNDSQELPIDLLPALRQRLAEDHGAPGAPQRSFSYAYALAAACVIVLGLLVYTQVGQGPAAGGERVAQGDNPSTPVAATLTQAESLLAVHDYVGAYRALKQAVEASPDDAHACEAQSQLAQIAFDELHWYPEAYAAHKTLMTKYLAEARTRPDFAKLKLRWETLDESRSLSNFASLEEFDAARRAGPESFAQLEGFVAQHEGTFLASAAVREMVRLAAHDEGGEEGSGQVQALEAVRQRCSNTVALAQIQYELGHVYATSGADLDKARSLLTEVAQGPTSKLASLARDSLARLEK